MDIENRRKYSREYNHRDYVKPKIKAYMKEYVQRPEVKLRQRIRSKLHYRKEEVRERKRIDRENQKVLVYKHYGGAQCVLCGETRVDCLSIDHINHDGGKFRKEIGSTYVYSWIIKNNYPEGYRILCMNCNHILGRQYQKDFLKRRMSLEKN